jgi:hypothetical protein
MKYYELESISETLKSLDSISKDIPFSAGLKIIKNRNSVITALEPYYELRKGIFTKYSDGKTEIKATDDNYTKASNEITELANQDTNINFEIIKESDLDNLSLPLKVIEALYPMLDSEQVKPVTTGTESETKNDTGGNVNG